MSEVGRKRLIVQVSGPHQGRVATVITAVNRMYMRLHTCTRTRRHIRSYGHMYIRNNMYTYNHMYMYNAHT